ncbi:MAG TPA: hypothetical protein VKB35_06935 [Ktedonobacteraceae bacterium]|nr:hypothetical protein [Ktedonobacteraceae bacterium]
MDSQKIEKFLRQEQESEQRQEFLASARAEMEKKAPAGVPSVSP